MPRIRTLTPEEAGPQAGPMLDDFKRTRGNIPNMYRTLSHRPEIATTLAAHQTAVMTRGEVPSLLKELVAVRVSQLNNCAYCMSSHTALVRRLGGTEEQLAELATFADSGQFTEAEKLALQLAEQLTLQPTEHISDRMWETLSQHYSEGEIVELVCAAAIFNYFNRINNFLDIEITK